MKHINRYNVLNDEDEEGFNQVELNTTHHHNSTPKKQHSYLKVIVTNQETLGAHQYQQTKSPLLKNVTIDVTTADTPKNSMKFIKLIGLPKGMKKLSSGLIAADDESVSSTTPVTSSSSIRNRSPTKQMGILQQQQSHSPTKKSKKNGSSPVAKNPGNNNNQSDAHLTEVIDVLEVTNEDPFTLETFEDLIDMHRVKDRDFIIARVTTVDPNDDSRYYYSYYTAHHINKVLFRTQPEEGLLHRMKAKNPLNNMTIVGDVYYYVVKAPPKSPVHEESTIESFASLVGNTLNLDHSRHSARRSSELFMSHPRQQRVSIAESGIGVQEISLNIGKMLKYGIEGPPKRLHLIMKPDALVGEEIDDDIPKRRLSADDASHIGQPNLDRKAIRPNDKKIAEGGNGSRKYSVKGGEAVVTTPSIHRNIRSISFSNEMQSGGSVDIQNWIARHSGKADSISPTHPKFKIIHNFHQSQKKSSSGGASVELGAEMATIVSTPFHEKQKEESDGTFTAEFYATDDDFFNDRIC